VLPELGRINVICGRNNSGKSTLLAAIAAAQSRVPGTEFCAGAEDALIHAALAATDWRRRAAHPDPDMVFGNLCGEVLRTRSIWYRDDDSVFADGVEKRFRSNPVFGGCEINAAGVAHAFRRQFTDSFATVLLPPKRALELNRSIALAERIEADGRGLLNFLFLAKNQPKQHSSRLLHDRIAAAFELITKGHRYEIFATPENAIGLHFSHGEAWIPAAACGLGMQDLLVMLYFALSDNHPVVLIEEPESHLHPDMQRRLLSFLRDETVKQYFLTTHSNVFVNNALVDRVYFTSTAGAINVSDETSRASILDDLGYSVTDNLVSDLVVLVEGPTDTPIVEEFLRKLGMYGRFEIKIWPLGGDIMDQLDLSVFAGHYKMLALVDGDPGSARVRRRFEERCREYGITVHRLSRYAIENYFTIDALRTVFHAQVPSSLNVLDPAISVEQQVGFNVKKSNRKVAQAMSVGDIEGTDLAQFFDVVREKLGA
jgi:hypothetical protein